MNGGEISKQCSRLRKDEEGAEADTEMSGQVYIALPRLEFFN